MESPMYLWYTLAVAFGTITRSAGVVTSTNDSFDTFQQASVLNTTVADGNRYHVTLTGVHVVLAIVVDHEPMTNVVGESGESRGLGAVRMRWGRDNSYPTGELERLTSENGTLTIMGSREHFRSNAMYIGLADSMVISFVDGDIQIKSIKAS